MSEETPELLPWQIRISRNPWVRGVAALCTLTLLGVTLSCIWTQRNTLDARAKDVAALEALLPNQPELFSRPGPPRPGDWRASHPQPEQSLAAYIAGSPNRPTPERSTIYLRAVGPWPQGDTELEELRAFAQAYFQVPVALGAPLKAPQVGTRTNEDTGKRQWRSDELLTLLQGDLPKDAFCVLGVTHVDLWPGDGWNFVFGQASLRDRTGIFSFARHDDAFFGQAPTSKAQKRLRDLKVMTHEIGHMFTMHHCQAYACNMNGSNSLPEADGQPLHLCPVCARKLHHAVGFDPHERHTQLERLYRGQNLGEQADWTLKRLEGLRSGGRAASRAYGTGTSSRSAR